MNLLMQIINVQVHLLMQIIAKLEQSGTVSKLCQGLVFCDLPMTAVRLWFQATPDSGVIGVLGAFRSTRRPIGHGQAIAYTALVGQMYLF